LIRSLRDERKTTVGRTQEKGFRWHSPDYCLTALSKDLVENLLSALVGGLAIRLQLRAKDVVGNRQNNQHQQALDISCRRFRPWKHGGASPNKGSSSRFDRVRNLAEFRLPFLTSAVHRFQPVVLKRLL
jgi:hypothetical protein